MKQLVGLFGQMCYVKGVHAVPANDHFVVTVAGDFDNLDSNVDIVALATIHQVVVDIVLQYTDHYTSYSCVY